MSGVLDLFQEENHVLREQLGARRLCFTDDQRRRLAAKARILRGRPPVMAGIRALIVRMATENRGRGYTRIQGALANLDHDVSRGTIANVLREHGLSPRPIV